MSIAPGSSNTNTLHLPPRFVLIRLFDSLRRPLPGATFEATLGSKTITGTADSEGYAQLDEASPPAQCEVRWKPATGAELAEEGDVQSLPFRRVLFLATDTEDAQTAVQHRLHNLGYDVDAPIEACIRAFQEDYELVVNGDAGDAAFLEKLASVHAAHSPVVAAPPVSCVPGSFDGGDE